MELKQLDDLNFQNKGGKKVELNLMLAELSRKTETEDEEENGNAGLQTRLIKMSERGVRSNPAFDALKQERLTTENLRTSTHTLDVLGI